MKFKILLTFVAFVFLGCEGKIYEDKPNGLIHLEIGEYVDVLPGDKIINASDDAYINIEHDLDEGTKRVTIKQGTADLLRGSTYVIK